LELRTWIKDPENGISGAKSLVLNEVWDIFKANNIELSFPQRDLHFKDALPVIISKEQS
jgi:small-conductance mechanosensitive channel